MKNDDGYVMSRFIYMLSVPGAIIYLGYLWLTQYSFGLAVFGYVFLGICFGSLLSLFKLEKPYRVASISSALIPLIAYIFILFLGYLEFNKVIQSGSIPISGGVIPLTPESYQQTLGIAIGIAVYALIICVVLTLPFAIIGYCGMFVGKSVSNSVGRILQGKQNEKNDVREIRLEKIKTLSVIFTSILSGVISIIIALIK